MQIKLAFGGEGVSYKGFGLSFALFKVWTGPPFVGYTSATNQALIGAALIETPVVDIGTVAPETAEKFTNLHGRRLYVKVTGMEIYGSNGKANVRLSVKEEVDGALEETAIEFVAEGCKGISATTGTIEFDVETVYLPEDEWNPNSFNLGWPFAASA